jgi:energy-coupling factor transport system ATP-binding protein
VSVGHRGNPPILAGVDLEFHPGEQVQVLGRSGAGKSSLALVLGGLIPPASGTVEVDGFPAHHPSARREVVHRVGFLFQNPETQLLTSRVWDEIAFGLENLGWSPARIVERVAVLLAELDLEPLAERAPRTLSGGEMQRVALAAAIAPGPPHLLLDEPAAHLDPYARIQIERAIATTTAPGGGNVLRLDFLPYLDSAPVRPTGNQRVYSSHLRQPRLVILEDGRVAHAGTGPLPSPLIRRLQGTDEPENAESLAELSPRHQGTILRARNLAGGWQNRIVFQGLDLELKPGTVTHLEGRSGAGKSTLLLTLAGLIPPLAGRIEIEPRAPLRARVGCVLQFAERLFYRPSVAEELAEFGRPGEMDGGVQRPIGRALELVRLPPNLLDRSPLALSGGEVRRVALAAGLIARRPVLLLDEPEAGLDGPGHRMLRRLIRSFAAAGGAVLVASHDPGLKELAGERWILAQGRLEPAPVQQPPAVTSSSESAPGSPHPQ